MNIYTLFKRELPFLYALPAILWQFFFVIVPLMVICMKSFFVYTTFSLSAYAAVFTLSHLYIIGRSIFYALSNAFLCLVIAYPIAYFFAVTIRNRGGKEWFVFFMLPFSTSFLVQIYAWFFLLEKDGFLNLVLKPFSFYLSHISWTTMPGAQLVVMVYCYLPFMLLALYTVLATLNVELLEAASDLGATVWQRFVYITVPFSLQAITTGFLLVLVPSFGEFVIPSLIGGAKYFSVGSLISYYFLSSSHLEIGAAFTVVSGFALLITSAAVVGSMNMIRAYFSHGARYDK